MHASALVLASTISCSLSDVVAPFQRSTHTPHPRHKIHLYIIDARDLELTQSCTGPHQNGSTLTNDPRDTTLADGYAGSPAPSVNVPARGGVSSVGLRRVQIQQLPPTSEEIEAMPDFLSPPTSQLDPRAEGGDPPGIQRPIGEEHPFFDDAASNDEFRREIG